MNNIKWIYLFAVLVSVNNLKGQSLNAGELGLLFKDINPDTLITAPNFIGINVSTYYIDINLDSVNDLQIESKSSISNNFSVIYVKVKSLNINTNLSVGSIDSTIVNTSFPPYKDTIVRTILRKYNFGGAITNGEYTDNGYLGYHNQLAGEYNVNSNQWLNSNSVYIGVRYVVDADTAYGWINTDVPNSSYSSVLLKEFSLSTQPNGIINYSMESNNLKIHPNPTQNTIQISCENCNIRNMSLFDVLGKEILQSTQNNIDVSNLPKGIYFIKAQTDKGVYVSNFVKE